MTAYGSIQDAVRAMKDGALDFLAKPIDPDHLLLLVERALAQRRLATENVLLKEELAVRRGAPAIIGEDASLKRVSVALQRAADDGRDGAAPGRERHGQGALRAHAARAQPAQRRTVRRDQLRGNSREPPRDGALRLRERRVHRRERAQAGPVRARTPGHAFPRRNRGAADRAPGEDPARARGAALRARRRHRVAAGGRPHRGGHQPEPQSRCGEPAVPRGPVLPAVRVSHRHPAAPRTQGGRRNPRALLHRALLPRAEEEAASR